MKYASHAKFTREQGLKILAKAPGLEKALTKSKYTISELCEIAECSPVTIRKLIWSGIAMMNEDKTLKLNTFNISKTKKILSEQQSDKLIKKTTKKVVKEAVKTIHAAQLENRAKRKAEEAMLKAAVKVGQAVEKLAVKEGLAETRTVVLIRPVADLPAGKKLKATWDGVHHYINGRAIASSNIKK
jgi:DNA-binding transcriptional MerR regulator